MTQSHPLPWYLVQFKPNSHHIARRNLERQDFETFLPLQNVTLRRSGKFREERRPLFPGYMFVALSPESGPWRQINGTLGISRLVSTSGRPQQVPTALVRGLQGRCDETGLLLPPETFHPGQQVALTSGPFASFVGTVERMQADRRVWVLLELMGRETRVQVDADNLSAEP